jgi:hypothetical protein
VEGGEFILIR